MRLPIEVNRTAVAAGLLAFLGGNLAYAPDVRRCYRLEREGLSATGHVVAVDPSQHNKLVYSFPTPRGEVVTWDYGYIGHVGDPVRVRYMPSNPSMACPCSPLAAAHASIGSGIAVGTFLGCGAAFAFAYENRRRKDLTEQTTRSGTSCFNHYLKSGS